MFEELLQIAITSYYLYFAYAIRESKSLFQDTQFSENDVFVHEINQIKSINYDQDVQI
jgi:hypothetical protein